MHSGMHAAWRALAERSNDARDLTLMASTVILQLIRSLHGASDSTSDGRGWPARDGLSTKLDAGSQEARRTAGPGSVVRGNGQSSVEPSAVCDTTCLADDRLTRSRCMLITISQYGIARWKQNAAQPTDYADRLRRPINLPVSGQDRYHARPAWSPVVSCSSRLGVGGVSFRRPEHTGRLHNIQYHVTDIGS